MIHKWNFIKHRRSEKGKQTRKKLITKIVWINCHASNPKSYFISPRNRFFSIEASPASTPTVPSIDSRIVILLAHKISHHPLTYCIFLISQHPEMEITFMADFLVKFEDNFGNNIVGYQISDLFKCLRLLHFISDPTHRWVNKLRSNASNFLPFSLFRLSRKCFCLFSCNFCHLIRFLIAICFFLSNLFEILCRANFITDITLLPHQVPTLEIVSGNEAKKEKKKFSFIFHFIFHCFRIIVVIVVGAIQLMRFYWKTVSHFFEVFITHLNSSQHSGQQWDGKRSSYRKIN